MVTDETGGEWVQRAVRACTDEVRGGRQVIQRAPCVGCPGGGRGEHACSTMAGSAASVVVLLHRARGQQRARRQTGRVGSVLVLGRGGPLAGSQQFGSRPCSSPAKQQSMTTNERT